MKRWIVILFFFISFLFLIPKSISARSGCCSWHGGVSGCDTSVGRQVCNDGTYSPSCGCAYIPPRPTPIIFPKMYASWQINPNIDKTFSLSVTLNDPSPSQYSAVINKCIGCDPGPLTDFYTNKFTFNNLKTGRYYLNVKKLVNNYWSTVAYWTIDIPEWSAPTIIPTPTITSITLTNQVQPSKSDDSLAIFLVFLILLILLGIVVAFIFIVYKLIRWFLKFAKKHDWIYGLLFWGAIILFWIISSLI